MAKIALTDRFIVSPKRVPVHGRVDFPDALVPGLALRVTASGHRSFVLIARYPANPKNPTRRALGDLGEITLDKARQRAREWLDLIRKGVDPKAHEARQRAETLRQQSATFGRVAEEFLARHAATLAHALQARRIVEAEFVARWRDRPITDILPEECAAAIRAIVRRGAPYQAFNALGYLRRIYSWAIGTNEFSVNTSPCDRLRPADLIGKREARDRILTDVELLAVWHACGGPVTAAHLKEARRRDGARKTGAPLGYPYGPLFRLMILTGQREREVADVQWSEVDFDNALWTIPASRMKGDRAHIVPLAPDALTLLKSLPRFQGDFVFTTTGGTKSVNGFSKAKARLDAASGVSGYVLHDLRRTVRTHFSALPVQDLVREAVIAHARPGLHKVYDLHSYEAEKRQCLELWEQRLRGIVVPKAPAQVTDIEAERALWAVP